MTELLKSFQLVDGDHVSDMKIGGGGIEALLDNEGNLWVAAGFELFEKFFFADDLHRAAFDKFKLFFRFHVDHLEPLAT